MKNSFLDLIDHNYNFPQEGFELKNGYLSFYGISLKYLIEKYGTPFKVLYLPRIPEQIQKARILFDSAIKQNSYSGKYCYSYCTKCCHFSHILKAALKEGVHLETSSSFDIDLIFELYKEGAIQKDTVLIHNGYKTDDYLKKIIHLRREGFNNSILILDSKSEIARVKQHATQYKSELKIGIRIAIDEEPQSEYSTSRLGIRPDEIFELFESQIKPDSNLRLIMVHFYIDSGIQDSVYYWGEFTKSLDVFIELKKACNSIHALNIGGGFPIKNSLSFAFDYNSMANKIVRNIKKACTEADVQDPDIFTEFGKYTVGESGANIFTVLEQKQQNEHEKWYIIDNSLLNTIPDSRQIMERFILLPINKWDQEYATVNIGGISCDKSDYYNSNDFNQRLTLPGFNEEDKEPLYIGFFHTGAYQDAISGYGGIKHCLIPHPKLIIIDRDEEGNLVDVVHNMEVPVQEMMSVLGYQQV